MSFFSEELVKKYPSLKKFDEQGDNHVEWKDGREQRLLQYIQNRPDFAAIQGNPTMVLKAVDEFANQQDFLISIGVDKANILSRLLVEEKPRVIVELGGYLGYSAVLFADQMRRMTGNVQDFNVWSLEFEPEFAKIATELINIAGLSDCVTVVIGPADETLRQLKADGKLDVVDFLFIDHVEDLYEQDLKTCEGLGLLRTGSCIVADNVVRPGAPKYREYVRQHPGLKSEGVKGLIMPGEFEDELEVSKVL